MMSDESKMIGNRMFQTIGRSLTVVGATMSIALSGARAGNVVQGHFSKKSTEKSTLNFAIDGLDRYPDSKAVLVAAVNLLIVSAPDGVQVTTDGTKDFDFVVEVRDSQVALPGSGEHRAISREFGELTDAYSYMISSHPHGPYAVRLLWDRLTLQKVGGDWIERPDALARVAAALAHEVYGNISSFYRRQSILLAPSHLYSDKYARIDRIESEVLAFRAGISAIARMIGFLQSNGFPWKTGAGLYIALEREKAALASWERQQSIEFEREGRSTIESFADHQCRALFQAATK